MDIILYSTVRSGLSGHILSCLVWTPVELSGQKGSSQLRKVSLPAVGSLQKQLCLCLDKPACLTISIQYLPNSTCIIKHSGEKSTYLQLPLCNSSSACAAPHRTLLSPPLPHLMNTIVGIVIIVIIIIVIIVIAFIVITIATIITTTVVIKLIIPCNLQSQCIVAPILSCTYSSVANLEEDVEENNEDDEV